MPTVRLVYVPMWLNCSYLKRINMLVYGALRMYHQGSRFTQLYKVSTSPGQGRTVAGFSTPWFTIVREQETILYFGQPLSQNLKSRKITSCGVLLTSEAYQFSAVSFIISPHSRNRISIIISIKLIYYQHPIDTTALSISRQNIRVIYQSGAIFFRKAHREFSSMTHWCRWDARRLRAYVSAVTDPAVVGKIFAAYYII